MQQTEEGKKKAAIPSLSRKRTRRPSGAKSTWILVGVAAAIVLMILLIDSLSTTTFSRQQSYKKVSGSGAGLNATITYDCPSACKQKFDFNVYIFHKDGQQVSVTQPDKNGQVRLALPSGDYTMLIGKQFGKDMLFPQEKVTLKNGEELQLKLQYKEGAS